MTIRRFDVSDTSTLCEIFYRSVREVARARYDPAQVEAWAPVVPDPARWAPRLDSFETFVAVDDAGTTVGWIAMTGEGYIDMLFCLPEATRSGVSDRLYAAVEDVASQRGLPALTAHASLLAQPFFGRHGWTVVRHETVVRGGVALPRAEMTKRLDGPRDA